MKCAGGDGACGGYLTTTTYGFTDEVALEPETVSGAEYLGCYKDDKNDRVMTLKEKNDEMTSEVRYGMIDDTGAVRFGMVR